MKVVLFPGQGVDKAAIARVLDARHPLVREAKEILGYDLAQRVTQAARGSAVLPTIVAQPATFVASLIGWERLRAEEVQVDYLLGHSLGEYAALVAGEAVSFRDALSVVHVRAVRMEEASHLHPGGMAAILGMELDAVTAMSAGLGLSIANDNAPGQVVVAGGNEALAAVAPIVRANGGRVIRLGVSGPFHTDALIEAASHVRTALEHSWMRSPSRPTLANVNARPYRSPGEIRSLLVLQLTSRVRFRESLDWLWDEGVRSYEDVGPGQVVAGLAKKVFGARREVEAAVGA